MWPYVTSVTTWDKFDHMRQYVSSVTCDKSHLSRSGRRFDLSWRWKFQQNMKIRCWGFHKINERKKSAEGPDLTCSSFRFFLTKIWSFFNFFCEIHNIHIIYAKTDHHTKFWQNILGIKEIKFLVYIHTKLGSLCRFF